MTQQSTYRQILKSSSIMGGAAAIVMSFGLVRTKFAAVLIGAAGVGMLANFNAIQGLISAISGLGIGSSAVRDVATAVSQGDKERIAQTVSTIRRLCLLTGVLGMTSIMALSPLLSQLTFGSDQYSKDIAALGVVILMVNVSNGQLALIRGMRRIGDLAWANIISALLGTVATIVFYVWMGVRGIIPALVVAAGMQLAVSWRFARRFPIFGARITWADTFRQASGMVRLGVAMMWTGVLSSIVVYATNMLITQQTDVRALGIYVAAFTLSGIFVNFVLDAMGTDFFPRLASVAHRKQEMVRLINQQIDVGVLIALPGLVAQICLAPWIVQLFYSTEFSEAADLLRWFVVGCMFRVIQNPIGLFQLAMGQSALFFVMQSAFNAMRMVLIIVGLNIYGIEGVAISFLLTHCLWLMIMLVLARRNIEFRWTKESLMLVWVSLMIIAVALLEGVIVPIQARPIAGIVLIAFTLVFALRTLIGRVGVNYGPVKLALRIPGIRILCGIAKAI